MRGIRFRVGTAAGKGAYTLIDASDDAGPRPPFAHDLASGFTVVAGADVEIDLGALIALGTDRLDPDAYAITRPPAFGTPDITPGGVLVYYAPADRSGPVSFTFDVADVAGRRSNTASVSGTVVPLPPSVRPGALDVPAGFSATVDLNALATRGTHPVNPAGFQVAAQPDAGGVTVNPAGVATFFAPAAALGARTFAFTASDTRGTRSAPAVVAVRVLVLPPYAADDGLSLPPDAVSAPFDPTFNDAAGTYPIASWTVEEEPAHGSLTALADGRATYAPEPGFEGEDAFTYRPVDDRDNPAAATGRVTITVTAGPLPPNVADATRSTPGGVAPTAPGMPLTLRLVDLVTPGLGPIDPDSFRIEEAPELGTLGLIVGGAVIYTPAPGESGVDVLAWSVADAGGRRSRPASLTLVVVAVPPEALPVSREVTAGQTTVLTFAALPGTHPLSWASFRALEPPAHGVIGPTDVDGRTAFTPAAGYAGPDVIVWDVADERGNRTGDVAATLAIRAVPPATAAASYTVVGGTSPATRGLPTTFRLIDRVTPGTRPLNPASIVTTTPALGALTLNPDGTVVYRANANASGVDGFDWTVADDQGFRSASSRAAVLVNPVAPIAVGDGVAVIAGEEIAVAAAANDLAGTHPIDLASLRLTAPPANGFAALAAGGVIRWTPATPGVATLAYDVADTRGNRSVPATITAEVTTAPVVIWDDAGVWDDAEVWTE